MSRLAPALVALLAGCSDSEPAPEPTPEFAEFATRARISYEGRTELADLDTSLILDVTATLTRGINAFAEEPETGEPDVPPHRAAFSLTGDDHVFKELDMIAHALSYTGALPNATRLDCTFGHVDVALVRDASLVDLRLDFDGCRDIPLSAFEGYAAALDREAGDRSDTVIDGSLRMLARLTPRPGSGYGVNDPPVVTRLEVGYDGMTARVGPRVVTVNGSDLRTRAADCRGQTVRRSTLLVEDSSGERAVLLDDLLGTLQLHAERSERAVHCNSVGASDSFSGSILYADSGRVDVESPLPLDLQRFVADHDPDASHVQVYGPAEPVVGAFELVGRDGRRARLRFHRREMIPEDSAGYLSMRKIERSVSLGVGAADSGFVSLAHVSYEDFLAGALSDVRDDDGDGLPAAWERIHGLDPTTNDASGDDDGDGRSALVEFGERTDPTNARERGLEVDERLSVSVGPGTLRSVTDYSDEDGMWFDVTASLSVESDTIAPEHFHFTLTLLGNARWADYFLERELCVRDANERVLRCDSRRQAIDYGRHGYGHAAGLLATGDPFDVTVPAIALDDGPLEVVARLVPGPLDAEPGNDGGVVRWMASFPPVDFAVVAPAEIHGNGSKTRTLTVEVHQLETEAASERADLYANVPPGVVVTKATVDEYRNGSRTGNVCSITNGIHCPLPHVQAGRHLRIDIDYEIEPGTSGHVDWWIRSHRRDVRTANDRASTAAIYVAPAEGLQRLVDERQAGATIVLPPGNHFGPILLRNKRLTLTGSDGTSPTVLYREGSGRATLDGAGSGSVLSNLHFRGGGRAVASDGEDTVVTVANSLFTPHTGAGETVGDLLHGSGSFRFVGNVVRGFGTQGTYARRGGDTGDRGLPPSRCRPMFEIRHTQMADIRRNVFVDNGCPIVSVHRGARADAIEASRDVLVANNTFVGNRLPFEITDAEHRSRDISIVNNIIVASDRAVRSKRTSSDPVGDGELRTSRNLLHDSGHESLAVAYSDDPNDVTVDAPDLAFDPMFVDPDDDFRLSPVSAAIDQGADVVPIAPATRPFAREIDEAVPAVVPRDGLLDGGAELDPGAYEFVP